MGTDILNKVKDKLKKLSKLYSLTFQRGINFGISQNGIKDQQNGME
jgi:hypothetical protein